MATQLQQTCPSCEKVFSTSSSLYRHIRNIHKSAYSKVVNGYECTLCQWDCGNYKNLVNHLECEHEVTVLDEKLNFTSKEMFLTWKAATEKETLSSFVKHRPTQRTHSTELSYYYCHRSGVYANKGNGVRSLKTQGSNKINANCPARMTVKETAEGVVVNFFKTHVGHTCDLGHLKVSACTPTPSIETSVNPLNFLSSCNVTFSSVTNPASTASEAVKTPEDTSKDTSEPDLNSRLEKLEKEKQVLDEKVTDLNDKYKRALAESENVRQRMQRQIADAKQFGIQGFCKDLLEVADILQRATETVPTDQLSSNHNPHLKSLYDGLCMTETQLQKVFRVHGLTQINPIGEKFNPNLHEALFEQAVEGKEAGTVAVVTKVGYKLHERTIRPALVGVVKAMTSSS